MYGKVTFILALCATSAALAAGTFETWIGADFDRYYVETGLGNETETSGYWLIYDDKNFGGNSDFSWPVFYGDPGDNFFADAIIDHCGGLCGTAILKKGTLTSNPYVGFGFSVVGEIPFKSAFEAGDASAWGGLCVTYTSDVDLQLELWTDQKIFSSINQANPVVTLPAAKAPSTLPSNTKNGNKVVVSWSDFKQPSWYNGDVKTDGETAAKQLVSIFFKLQTGPGKYKFNICAVGPKDGTCPEQCGIPSTSDAIKVARGTSAVNAILNGRTLGFTGIKASATVEVMNSLGQVVMKNAINNASDNAATLNLAALDAGIYMVRVSGKSINFAKKIVLR